MLVEGWSILPWAAARQKHLTLTHLWVYSPEKEGQRNQALVKGCFVDWMATLGFGTELVEVYYFGKMDVAWKDLSTRERLCLEVGERDFGSRLEECVEVLEGVFAGSRRSTFSAAPQAAMGVFVSLNFRAVDRIVSLGSVECKLWVFEISDSVAFAWKRMTWRTARQSFGWKKSVLSIHLQSESKTCPSPSAPPSAATMPVSPHSKLRIHPRKGRKTREQGWRRAARLLLNE